ncbi:hypothetical protein EV359DRAFT_63693 [Lentinula novae-zelandiae]|nr:hypothetical protein EV359DRAFT_63693 [Lentinula novae-zelandiae]
MPPIWRMTPDELKENLTRLTVILQRSMDHASQHRLINQVIPLLQPYHDEAVVLWEHHWLGIVPAMVDSDARRKWFQDVDEFLREDRVPAPDDITSWCLRAFVAFAALQAMHTHDMGYLNERVNGSINQYVMRESSTTRSFSYIQITRGLPPTPVPHPGPPTGITLIGTKLHMKDSNTGLDTEYTIIDSGHTTLGGDMLYITEPQVFVVLASSKHYTLVLIYIILVYCTLPVDKSAPDPSSSTGFGKPLEIPSSLSIFHYPSQKFPLLRSVSLLSMDDVSWLENPLGPYYLGDSFELDDADGVSLGSPSSTGEPPHDEALTSELISNDQVDIGVNNGQRPSTVLSQHSLGPASTREQQLKSFISSRPKSSSQPAIIRLNDANGVIHFQNAGLTSHPPPHLAPAGGLVVSKPAAKGAPLLKLPSKPLERPAGQDGRFTSAQKGKKRAPATIQRESSFPDLLYPPDFKLDKRPPKEKAGERDLRIERNFIHLHQLLTLDQSTLAQLLTALNKLQSDFTAFLNDFNLNSQPSLPPLPPPSASPPSPPAPTTPLSTLTPEPSGSTSDVRGLTGTCPDLLSRITDGPSLSVTAIHKRARSEHESSAPSPSKVPRISSQHHFGHSTSAILLAPARWALPTSSAAIIAMIGRWQPFFAARGASLPLPDLAERLDANQDGSYVVRLYFSDTSLNTFMRTWKTHQPNIPEIFDVSMTRSSVY